MKWQLRILPNKENEQAAQELKILEENVSAARDFLRKNRKNFFKGKKKIPIYLILGPSRFGKTTILSQSGLDLIDCHKQPFENAESTRYCSFWFAKDAIYIDTAGNYTKPDVSKPRNDIIWRGFIKLLQKYFGKDSVSGILIILDLPAISEDKNLLKKTLFCIRERIYELATLIKNLHTHLIFTKCDRILGFAEFFSSLDPEERKEPFGISFSLDKKTDPITKFEVKFNKLLESLNNRIIGHLQKTIQPKDRSLIKTFPSQLDHLRQTFTEVLSKIPNSSQILLSGVYFTSSIQNGSPINPIKNTANNILGLQEESDYKLESHDNRSYFIEKIFRKSIIPPPKQRKKRRSSRIHPQIEYIYAFTTALLIIAASSIVSYMSYQKNITAINKTTIAIENKDLYNHNNLHKVISEIKPDSNSWWLTFGLNKIKPIYNSLVRTHQILFVQKLSSQLENYLEEILASKDPDKTQKLYRALQAYLMFGDHEKLDPSYVKAWFNNYWARTNNDGGGEETDLLNQQLNITLQYKFKAELNHQLIDNIRHNLKSLPSIELVYLLLKNKYVDQDLKADNKTSIQKFYTKENFHKVYENSIPELINNLPKNDPALGELDPEFAADKNDATNELREMYIEKYVATWENELKLEANKEFKTLTEAANYLNNISANNSPLLKLLKKIKQNTNIKNPPKKLKAELNTKLQKLDETNLIKLQKNLDQLAHYINNVAENSDHEESPFSVIAEHLQDESIPNPITSLRASADNQAPWLKIYLNGITANVWQLLLKSVHLHIAQEWNQKIIPEYRDKLANKYPIFKNGKKDVSLDDFNKFFGSNGTIDNFFKKYIEPLISTEKNDWQWKDIDGQKVGFSQEFLEAFLRASMIKKMFFAPKASKPKLRFSLTPIAMTPETQKFALHIDGQKIAFANNKNKKTNHLIWPGPQTGSVTISFVNAKGKYFTTSEFGTWAWFRILDKSNVSSNNSTRRFELAFNLNGNTAKYTLSTPDPINPFIPDIINNFRCIEIN